MADRSTQSIVVDASPAEVMAVVADFAAYPEWAQSIKACEVVEDGPDGRPAKVKFTMDAGIIKDVYTLGYTWAPDGLRVDWNLLESQMQKSQQGEYVLEAEGDSTRVTYSLSVEVSIPLLGMLRRKAERMIMDTALKELKRRVEALP
jgi:ribosome-associated toxin RatA of RatAB toxin-antitoxin module